MTLWESVDEAGRMRRAEYAFGSAGRATCTALDLGGGRLALVSPPGGPEAPAILAELDTLGEVAAVLAPNPYHRMGMPLAAARYPKAALFAPEAAIPRARKGLDGAREVRPLAELQPSLPDGLEILIPPHMKSPDTVLRLHTPQGTVWTFHDILLNIEVVSSNPVERWALGLLGYQRGLRVNRFGCRWVLVADKPAFAAWLRAELERLPPAVFAPGHGPIVRDGALLARLLTLADEIGRL